MANDTRNWQEKLEDACLEYNIAAPVFQIISDRRGGRTAWSSIVLFYGMKFAARFWYDGKNLNNAKEDAAEVALQWLTQSSSPSGAGSAASSPSTTRSAW